MDRYDEFLSRYIPEYLKIDLIDEIIITDENGNDIEKIERVFPTHPKLRLYKNETRLGAFLNKMRAYSFAKNEWIALIDSDNFADESYFATGKNYIDANIGNQKNVILSPVFAKPNLNYNQFSGHINRKGNFVSDINQYITVMNNGNYIINRYLIDNLIINKEDPKVKMSHAWEAIHLNNLFIEQLDANIHMVPGMEYYHEQHANSLWSTTHMYNTHIFDEIYGKYLQISKS